MPHCFARVAAFLLFCLAGAPSAAELAFAHFAPGAGLVLVQVDAEPPRVLGYKDYEGVYPYEAGARRIAAIAQDGRVLAEGTLGLLPNDRYVVILAGNGSALAPFQLRVATDHNRVFIAGQSSLQEASLAIFATTEATALHPLLVRDSCHPAARYDSLETFGYGTRPLTGTGPSGGFSVMQHRPTCVQTAADPAAEATALAQVSIAAQPGDRLRRFLIGDGTAAPYEMIVVNQGREAILDVMEADGSIEGLWSIEGDPKTGLQVAYDGEAPAGERISAVYFGFEPAGRASWRTVEKMQVVEYIGGNVEGTRAAVGFDRGAALITPHSCNEMSMVVFMEGGAPTGRVFPPPPRNTLRLKRLFPPICPPAVPNGQEEKP